MPHNRPETAAVQESCKSSVARSRRTVIECVSVALHKTGLSSASATTCSAGVAALVCCHGRSLRCPSTEARPPLGTAVSPGGQPRRRHQAPRPTTGRVHHVVKPFHFRRSRQDEVRETARGVKRDRFQRLHTPPYGQGQLQRLRLCNLGVPHSAKSPDLSDTPSICRPLRGTAY